MKSCCFFRLAKPRPETKLWFFEQESTIKTLWGSAHSRYMFPKFLESLATSCPVFTIGLLKPNKPFRVIERVLEGISNSERAPKPLMYIFRIKLLNIMAYYSPLFRNCRRICMSKSLWLQVCCFVVGRTQLGKSILT